MPFLEGCYQHFFSVIDPLVENIIVNEACMSLKKRSCADNAKKLEHNKNQMQSPIYSRVIDVNWKLLISEIHMS